LFETGWRITPFINQLLERGLGSLAFCSKLLTDYQVAVIPGVAFGAVMITFRASHNTTQLDMARQPNRATGELVKKFVRSI
jgi:aspartate/methionine/tyrosine aminotransferase